MYINFYKNKKSLLKLLLILTIISCTLFYSPQKNLISGDTSYNNDELSNVYFPNTSDGEITINTPENKTYTEPMEGYYPATYGFENDLDGTIPQDWLFGIDNGGTAQVVSEIGGRKKVVQLVDTITNGYPRLIQTFTSQTTGIVEFYIRKESGSTQAGVELRSAGTIATGIRIDYGNNGKFEVYQGASYLEIASGDYSDQTWFHIKIAFDTSTDTADFYVNGALEASNVAFKQNVASIDRIYFGPNYAYTGSFYFDAVGYSWDSDYNIGDNMDEGLLLSFENSTNFDWIGYSLDGQSNKTILGNTTIPLPEVGYHTIQVFGNDSLGAIYESGIRYFAVDQTHYIEIITPESITYTEPMEGYYPATYGFENDLDGTTPQEWFFGVATGGTAQVISELGVRKKVVQLVDTVTNGYPYLTQTFTPKTTGIVEFYVRKESGSTQIGIELRLAGVIATGMRIDYGNNGKFEAYQGAGHLEIASGDYSDQTWFHIKIAFDTSTDTADFYVNGALEASNVAFKQNVASIDRIYFGPNYAYTGSFYFDAVGYSWDSDYNIGDNLKEGLLLSYTNTTNFDWIGYSLDGSPNITITGNTIIPFPENGMHSIILNGITSYGVLIKSESRDFAVVFQEPHPPLGNPYIIPIISVSIVIGIIALLSIAIFLFRRNFSSRTSSTIISHKYSQLDEKVDSGSDQISTCPLCHTQIKTTDQFCEYCGTSLKKD